MSHLYFPLKSWAFTFCFYKNGNLEWPSWNPKDRIFSHWTGSPDIGVVIRCWHWNLSFSPSFSTVTAGGSFILQLVAIWLQQLQVSHSDPTHLEGEETVSSHGLLVDWEPYSEWPLQTSLCGFLGRTGSCVQAWSSHWWVRDEHLEGVNHTLSEAKMVPLLWAIRVNIKPDLGALV